MPYSEGGMSGPPDVDQQRAEQEHWDVQESFAETDYSKHIILELSSFWVAWASPTG